MIPKLEEVYSEVTEEIYKHFKNKRNEIYNEEYHCKLLIKTMMDKSKGCYSYFCADALITERTFFNWLRNHEIFASIYCYSRMVAKTYWYAEGRELKEKEFQVGALNYEMEHWKMMGWTKFGISRNSRIRINVDPEASPAKHYEDILKQAASGDFTASEFKQLMEAVNVGINVHQVYELQKQIDELKSDLTVMSANTNVQNPFTNKGIEKKD